jgi:4-hydroxy 2-oxovalerate aldolase
MITLDATFRDGGYYNNWNFSVELANEYLAVMEKSKVNAVEIGFRSPPKKEVGTFGKVTDFFIEDNLYIPDIDYFGVMINGSEYDLVLAERMFNHVDVSPINLVRNAVHFSNVNDDVRDVMQYLKSLGYTLCLNLMQAADKSYDEIRDVSKLINSWKCIDVLYIADSLGGMNHDTVDYAFEAVREGWEGLIGFHGHNNKGQALDNTLEAIDIGVDWVDSTILGMGRGPGNTETEYLLGELNKRGFGEFNLEPVYEFALKNFYQLKERYQWGPSLLYFLSAEYNIHPTYVQTMLLENYPLPLILKVLNRLKDVESNSFNKEILIGGKTWYESCLDNSSKI